MTPKSVTFTSFHSEAFGQKRSRIGTWSAGNIGSRFLSSHWAGLLHFYKRMIMCAADTPTYNIALESELCFSSERVEFDTLLHI